MIHHRLTLFAVLIFILTLLPASTYANEAGVGSTGASQVNNIMNMPGHDMSGHTMESPGSNITGQSPSTAGTQQTTGNIPTDSTDMAGHNMGGNGSDTASNQTSSQDSGQNPQANDITDTSAGDMPDHNMNGIGHEMPAAQTSHDMMNMPAHSGGAVQDSSGHQAAGHGGSLNPSAKEINRASLLGGFGLVDGFIVLAALILKRKNKVGGSV